jgi:predicted nucleotidyltransferase
MEKAFLSLSCADITFTPNNILGIEYIKAIISLNSSIKPHTVKRLGSGYNCSDITEDVYQSASAIRNIIDDESALDFVPDCTRDIVRYAIECGDAPAKTDNLSAPIISYFRLNPTSPKADILDAGDGLYNRIRNASFDANDISSLVELSSTKNYTKARIRRAIFNSYFGVTSSDAAVLPKYTQVLAMSKKGTLLLKKTRESSEFKILTKPSAFDSFPDEIKSQKLLSDRADSIYELSKPLPKSGRTSLRLTPFVKK